MINFASLNTIAAVAALCGTEGWLGLTSTSKWIDYSCPQNRARRSICVFIIIQTDHFFNTALFHSTPVQWDIISAVLQTDNKWKMKDIWVQTLPRRVTKWFYENDDGFHDHIRIRLKKTTTFKHQMQESLLEKEWGVYSAVYLVYISIFWFILVIHFSLPWVFFWNCGIENSLKGNQ